MAVGLKQRERVLEAGVVCEDCPERCLTTWERRKGFCEQEAVPFGSQSRLPVDISRFAIIGVCRQFRAFERLLPRDELIS